MILKNCPYVKSVEIETIFPDTVCFVIVEKELGWYLEFGKEYYSLDYDMELLALESNEERVTKRGLTKLILPQVEEVIISENKDEPNVPVFASNDEQLRKETLEIIDKFRTHEIKSRLSMLDLSNRFQISMTIDQKYEVYFGEMSNFDIKMKTLQKVLEEAEKSGYIGGELTWTMGSAETSGTFAFKGKLPQPDAEDTSEENQ